MSFLFGKKTEQECPVNIKDIIDGADKQTLFRNLKNKKCNPIFMTKTKSAKMQSKLKQETQLDFIVKLLKNLFLHGMFSFLEPNFTNNLDSLHKMLNSKQNLSSIEMALLAIHYINFFDMDDGTPFAIGDVLTFIEFCKEKKLINDIDNTASVQIAENALCAIRNLREQGLVPSAQNIKNAIRLLHV
jgi:hypothetical protein